MKKLSCWMLFLFGISFLESCSSIQEDIEKSFRQYVHENIDNPQDLKEIVSIEIKDTVCLYERYHNLYTAFQVCKIHDEGIREKINKYDWQNAEDVDSLFYLKRLKSAYLEYQESYDGLQSYKNIALEADSVYKANKNEILLLYEIKVRYGRGEDLKLDRKDFIYYPKNKKTYKEPRYEYPGGYDLYKVLRDINKDNPQDDLFFLRLSIDSLQDKLETFMIVKEKVDKQLEYLKK